MLGQIKILHNQLFQIIFLAGYNWRLLYFILRWHRQQKRDKALEGMIYENGEIRSIDQPPLNTDLRQKKDENSTKSWITIELLSNLAQLQNRISFSLVADFWFGSVTARIL